MGHVALARTARAHAIRAAALAWIVLSLVIGVVLWLPHGWFGALVPIGDAAIVPVAAAIAAAAVLFLPLERLGDTIIGELRAASTESVRLRNIVEEISIAIGEATDHVVVHDSAIPNVGAFPTSDDVVVMATSEAVERLERDELEALVAAQFAGMRDRWCRLATRAELVWKATIVVAIASIVVAQPLGVMIGAAMLFVPRTIEAARDLCADVAAVTATRHPEALAEAFRHLTPSASDGNRQRLTERWYLPVSPFLALPKRIQTSSSVSVMGREPRTYTDADEVRIELELRADRAAALAGGADPRDYTGREYRRRWGRLGTDRN